MCASVVSFALACGKAESDSREGAHAAGALGVGGSWSSEAVGGSDAVGGAEVLGNGGGGASADAAVAGHDGEVTAGRGGSAEGGQAAGGSASVATGGKGNVWQGTVAPGTCGIARRISTPSINEVPRLRRYAGGFMAGPRSASGGEVGPLTIDWLGIDASGEQQTEYRISMPSGIGGSYIVNFGVSDQVVAFAPIFYSDGPADILSAAMNDGVATVQPYVTVFEVTGYNRLTAFMDVTPSLDGQRAVVAAGPGRGFTIAVVAADGRVVGSPHTLSADSDAPTCRAVRPTDHAGAVSIVESEDGSESFHRLELTEAGDVAWEVKVPLNRARPPDWRASALPCPLLALTPSGIALLVFESVAYREAWHLHRINRDGTSSDEPWETLPQVPRGFAIQGADAFALTVRNESPTIVKRSNGRDQSFPIDVELTVNGPDVPLASEAGSLFIDSRPLGDWRQIVEVTCP
jgi:hypothetical protein